MSRRSSVPPRRRSLRATRQRVPERPSCTAASCSSTMPTSSGCRSRASGCVRCGSGCCGWRAVGRSWPLPSRRTSRRSGRSATRKPASVRQQDTLGRLTAIDLGRAVRPGHPPRRRPRPRTGAHQWRLPPATCCTRADRRRRQCTPCPAPPPAGRPGPAWQGHRAPPRVGDADLSGTRRVGVYSSRALRRRTS